MPKKKSTYFKEFRPFIHHGLEWKQRLLEMARDKYEKREEDGGLSTSLLYASLVDYLTLHLLMSLREYVKLLSRYTSSGLVYSGVEEREYNTGAGKYYRALKDYSFPMKDEIMLDIKKVSDARNHLFHELAIVQGDELGQLDNDVDTIHKHTEMLVTKMDLLYANFPIAGVTEETVQEDQPKG